MSDVIWTAAEARDQAAAALAASRTSRANAEAVADALVRAELDGIPSHGLSRLPAYAAQARAGKVDGNAVPNVSRPSPAAVLVDACCGFAFPAFGVGLPALAEATQENGVASACLANSHHAGVLGHVVEDLARLGLIALAMSNTPAAIAPWGGRRGLFGTNPIAFASPLPDRQPLVIDLSLSRVARGKIVLAADKGEPIPEGWAFDAEGNPTTDARAAAAGTMAPIGDAKGAQLALMVELLAAALTGANFAYQASSMFDDKGPPPRLGQFVLAIRPEAFGHGATLRRTLELAGEIERDGQARLAGARRFAVRNEMQKSGIRIGAKLAAAIRSLAA